jgi:Ras-related protein Rab-1A
LFLFQGVDPPSLAIGTQVSAKYKGAYCEAKVRSVDKQIKVRVTLKGLHGAAGPTITISDKDIEGDTALANGALIKTKHPDSQEVCAYLCKQKRARIS